MTLSILFSSECSKMCRYITAKLCMCEGTYVCTFVCFFFIKGNKRDDPKNRKTHHALFATWSFSIIIVLFPFFFWLNLDLHHICLWIVDIFDIIHILITIAKSYNSIFEKILVGFETLASRPVRWIEAFIKSVHLDNLKKHTPYISWPQEHWQEVFYCLMNWCHLWLIEKEFRLPSVLPVLTKSLQLNPATISLWSSKIENY